MVGIMHDVPHPGWETIDMEFWVKQMTLDREKNDININIKKK